MALEVAGVPLLTLGDFTQLVDGLRDDAAPPGTLAVWRSFEDVDPRQLYLHTRRHTPAARALLRTRTPEDGRRRENVCREGRCELPERVDSIVVHVEYRPLRLRLSELRGVLRGSDRPSDGCRKSTST
jgi:hypothetical protein